MEQLRWGFAPFTLQDQSLLVRELRAEDVPAVALAVQDPAGWAARAWGTAHVSSTEEFLRRQLASRDRGDNFPLVYFVEGEPAGITGLHSLAERRKAVEIGFTLVAPRWRRTHVNARVKRVLLRHCFETLGCVRVEFRVDAKNYRSQLAVLRLGARFDGKIDFWHAREDDPLPQGHIYSVTRGRWPLVQARLDALLAGKRPAEEFFPYELASARLNLTRSILADAPDLLALAHANEADLPDNFPQLHAVRDLAGAEAYIAERAHSAAAGTCVHYLARANGRVVGHLQVKDVNQKLGRAELGYLVDGANRRRGLGAEMLRLVLEAFPLPRITLRVLPENEASFALAKHLGFAREGVLRAEHVTAGGERRDTVLLARIRDSFRADQGASCVIS